MATDVFEDNNCMAVRFTGVSCFRPQLPVIFCSYRLIRGNQILWSGDIKHNHAHPRFTVMQLLGLHTLIV